jgi:membrane-bound lytic murein transglycosylase B
VRFIRPTRRSVVAAARTVRSWSRRPHGRLAIFGASSMLMLGAAGTAGAWVVPTVLRADAAPTPAAPPATTAAVPASATGSAAPGPGEPLPAGLPTTTPVRSTAPSAGARPADVLAPWAAQVAAATGIPPVAVQAYGYAELVVARTTPACRLSWTTLAAIGKVESAHGNANGATLGADGQALPPIRGLPLDGNGGRLRIMDTDHGLLDGDVQFDRAIGPMQFIPATWRAMAVDADNDGVADPNDIDDAAMAAANYLCRGGRDMSTSEDWWAAILSYNDVRRYARDVFNAANDYGLKSRT